MFNSPVRKPAISRPLAFGGSLALAALLVVPSVAFAAPSASAILSGDTLSAAVTDARPRVGVWRLRIVAPGGNQRVDFTVRANDIDWSGRVRVSKLVDGSWTVVSRRYLEGTPHRLLEASGSVAGVRWDTSNFRLPNDGNGHFEIEVELLRDGSYKVVGYVRVAREAFIYGPWSRTDSREVAH